MPKVDQPETLFKLVEKKPKTPTKKELDENLSSRSAKLRYAIKKEVIFIILKQIFLKSLNI